MLRPLSSEDLQLRLYAHPGRAGTGGSHYQETSELTPDIFRKEEKEFATKADLIKLEARVGTLEQLSQWNPTGRFLRVSAKYQAEKRGLRILNRGVKISALLFGFSISLLVVNTGIGLAGAYLAGAYFLIHLYAHWLETGEVILNPRYVVAGIIGSVALALTSLVAMVT